MHSITTATSGDYEYLLGDAPVEAERLKRQSDLWDPVSRALFDRIGVAPGWKVLEVGPGEGSLHRELRRRVRGPVDAVEHSKRFARELAAKTNGDGLGEGRIWASSLADADLPEGGYDLVFARWVFLFLPNPEWHVRKLVRALEPGGILAIQDYRRETLAMSPEPPEWADFAAADRAFFAARGGDASVASRLPGMFHRAGLGHIETHATLKAGHPGSPEWSWLSDYFLGVLDRYAEIPPLSRDKAERLRNTWVAAAEDPSALLIAPAVLDVVGRKGSAP